MDLLVIKRKFSLISFFLLLKSVKKIDQALLYKRIMHLLICISIRLLCIAISTYSAYFRLETLQISVPSSPVDGG